MKVQFAVTALLSFMYGLAVAQLYNHDRISFFAAFMLVVIGSALIASFSLKLCKLTQ